MGPRVPLTLSPPQAPRPGSASAAGMQSAGLPGTHICNDGVGELVEGAGGEVELAEGAGEIAGGGPWHREHLAVGGGMGQGGFGEAGNRGQTSEGGGWTVQSSKNWAAGCQVTHRRPWQWVGSACALALPHMILPSPTPSCACTRGTQSVLPPPPLPPHQPPHMFLPSHLTMCRGIPSFSAT